jgi:hypothetical protein
VTLCDLQSVLMLWMLFQELVDCIVRSIHEFFITNNLRYLV